MSLDDGQRFAYDKLVIATGADTNAREIPGLAEHAATIWTTDSMLEVRRRFERDARPRAGAASGSECSSWCRPNNKCSGPLYEIVFMLETWLRRNNARDPCDITWSTYEDGFIQAFGPRLHDLVTEEFAERGIDGHVERGRDRGADGRGALRRRRARASYDHLIAFPPYVAAVRYPACESDERGFVRPTSRRGWPIGRDDIYAPGDAGDFPIKQAFLAFLQADAVAGTSTPSVSGSEFDQPFDSVSMCIMEMFDKATFAQVPVELTGDPEHPVRVRPTPTATTRSAPRRYGGSARRCSASPCRCASAAGEPFHAGKAWQAMDVGIKAMSTMLADEFERRPAT